MNRLARASCLVALTTAFVSFADKQNDPLTLGIAQPYGAEAAARVPAAVEPYLSKGLRGPVKVTVFETPEALAEALATGKVDLAWITPLAFVQATKKNPGVTALSKAMRKGELTYRAVFFVKKSSSATELKELKGKHVAYVSKTSTSGYLFAREILKKASLPDSFFGEESFEGDHLAVCKAVKEGRADVGATFGNEVGTAKEVVAQGCVDAGGSAEFRVVSSTGPLPNEVIAARDFFPPTRVNDVIATFGRMDGSPEGKKALEAFRVDGWGVAVDGDFTPVLDLMNLQASPKKSKR